jgi:hypothetical protein
MGKYKPEHERFLQFKEYNKTIAQVRKSQKINV